jgi:hypothetical protein
MKNIHILPTDKPSRLCIDNSCNELNYSEIEGLSSKHITNQHISITNDEEIKEGYVLHLPTNRILEVGVIAESNGSKSFREKEYYINGIEVLICDCKKIILTTDPYLIADNVQAIDDEFLEFFVKNPSCENIPIITTIVNNESLYNTNIGFESWRKEEPKQETLEDRVKRLSEGHDL